MYVEIEPGTEQGDEIHFENGIAVSIVQKSHPLFERRGSDLLFRKSVSLREALCGVRFRLQHLDGRILLLSNERGSVVQPGSLFTVPGEGFRVKGKRREFGDLFIMFDVIFPRPDEIDVRRLQQILGLVPASERVDESADVSFCHFSAGQLEDFGKTDAEEEQEKEEEDDEFD
jgi:DnaJ-class molecular chaperone